MKYQVVRGFCLGGGIDLHPGQTAELPERQAELYLRQGRIRPVPPEVDLSRASLLAAIAIAESLEILNELVTQDETDPDIIGAYQLRALELEEEGD